MPYSRIRSELNQLAGKIWDDVTLVRGTPGPWQLGEVTITQMLHLRLLQSGLLTGLVHYNVPHEPTTGADWEWFVQLPQRGRRSTTGQASYLHYRVQAKVLTASTAGKLKFAEINHNSGRQRATLLSAAKAVGAIPYYAFYIGDPWPTSNPISLPPWRGARPKKHFGCTAVPAPAVDAIYAGTSHGTRTAANQYLGHATPSWGVGRRLSDLFPIPPSRAGSNPWSPTPPSPDDEPADDEPADDVPTDDVPDAGPDDGPRDDGPRGPQGEQAKEGRPTDDAPALPRDPQQVYGESPDSGRLAKPLSPELSELLGELRGLSSDRQAPVVTRPAHAEDHQLRMTAFITLDDLARARSTVATAATAQSLWLRR